MPYKDKEEYKRYQRKYQLKWSRKNKEIVRTRSRKYKLEHPDKIKAWKDSNPNYNKEYYRKNKERVLLQNKDWAKRNPGKILEIQRRWRNKKTSARQRWLIKPETILTKRVRQITYDNFKIDNECSSCKSKKNLEFHHWTYRIPVDRKHFSTLCRKCHSFQHNYQLYL